MIRKRTLILIGLCLLLLSPFIEQPTSDAEVVWSEDFDDEDLEGWTIAQGNFSVADGMLRSIVREDFGSGLQFMSVMWRPSTVAVGTWSFDFMFDSPTEFPWINVDFMSLTQHTFVMNSRGKNYSFFSGSRPNYIGLYVDDQFPGSVRNIEKYQTIKGTKRQVWHHIDITRDDEGRLRVFIDGDLGIDVIDETYSESVAFGIMLEHSWRGDAVIDNIVVSDTIDVLSSTDKEEKKQIIPGFPIESIIMGLLIGAFIFWTMQRRK